MLKMRGHLGQAARRLALTFCNAVVDFIFPPFCLLCRNRLDEQWSFVCAECWDKLPPIKMPLLPCAQLSTDLHKNYHFSASLAAFQYSAEIQDLIHHMKYKALPGLATRFGRDIGRLAAQLTTLPPIDVIVPVPLHSTRLRERGYNQALVLANAISVVLGKPVATRALVRSRYTSQQARLGREERATNMRGAFRLRNAGLVAHKNIALVDDVLTTGSTLNECAAVLKAAGAGDITCFTIVRI